MKKERMKRERGCLRERERVRESERERERERMPFKTRQRN